MEVLVIDKCILIRKGFAYILSGIEEDISVSEADSMEYGARIIENRKIDIVVADVMMYLEWGKKIGNHVKLLVTSNVSEGMNEELIRGVCADGFLSKEASEDEIRCAVSMIKNNNRYYNQYSFGNVRSGLLTSREKEVMKLVKSGLTNAEIGERLFITESTAKKHVSSILAKLNLKSRVELAILK